MDKKDSLKSNGLEEEADSCSIISIKARDVVKQFKGYPSIVPAGEGITLYNPPLKDSLILEFRDCLIKELREQGYDVQNIPVVIKNQPSGYSIDVEAFLRLKNTKLNI